MSSCGVSANTSHCVLAFTILKMGAFSQWSIKTWKPPLVSTHLHILTTVCKSYIYLEMPRCLSAIIYCPSGLSSVFCALLRSLCWNVSLPSHACALRTDFRLHTAQQWSTGCFSIRKVVPVSKSVRNPLLKLIKMTLEAGFTVHTTVTENSSTPTDQPESRIQPRCDTKAHNKLTPTLH